MLKKSYLLVLIFILIIICDCIPETEYYDVLGLKPTCSDEDIKKAFRKLSVEKHPDRNRSPNAQDEFVKISEAYEVLKDPDSRHMYDMYGKEGVNRNANRNDQQGGMFGGIFDHFFGGGGGGGDHHHHHHQKTQDVVIEMGITLQDLYLGATRQISYKRNVLCSHCRGTGAEGAASKKCPKCGGSGQILVEQQIMPGFRMQTQQPCPVCHGKGQTYAKECKICHGQGIHPQLTTLDVQIEKGMKNGDEIRFERKAEERPGFIPGDIIVKIKQLNHEYFIRDDKNNLHTSVEINLLQSLLGFDLNIQHLDQHWINLKHEKDVTSHGQIKRYNKEGMPKHHVPSEFGDLFVTYNVKFPDTLTTTQQQKLRQLFPNEPLEGEYIPTK